MLAEGKAAMAAATPKGVVARTVSVPVTVSASVASSTLPLTEVVASGTAAAAIAAATPAGVVALTVSVPVVVSPLVES